MGMKDFQQVEVRSRSDLDFGLDFPKPVSLSRSVRCLLLLPQPQFVVYREYQ